MLITVALLASATALAAEPARCRPGADRARTEAAQTPRARPLGDMPDARPVLTVYRKVNGCAVLLVRDRGRIVEEPVGRPELRRAFRP